MDLPGIPLRRPAGRRGMGSIGEKIGGGSIVIRPRMRIYPRGLRGNSFTEDQPIPADSVSDYACTLQEVDVQRRQVRIWIIAPFGPLICGIPVSDRGY